MVDTELSICAWPRLWHLMFSAEHRARKTHLFTSFHSFHSFYSIPLFIIHEITNSLEAWKLTTSLALLTMLFYQHNTTQNIADNIIELWKSANEQRPTIQNKCYFNRLNKFLETKLKLKFTVNLIKWKDRFYIWGLHSLSSEMDLC